MNNNNRSGATIEQMGSIKLTDLQYAQVTQANGLNYLMIPIEYNPCLYLGVNKQDNKPYVSMDVTVWRSQNLKNGNTHFIRASVGSKKAKTMSEDQKKASSPIIGNLKPAQSAQDNAQQGYTAPGAPVPPAPQGYVPQPPVPGQPYPAAPQGIPDPGWKGSGYGNQQGPYPQQQPYQAPAPQAPQQRPPYPPQAQGGAFVPGAGQQYVPGDIPPGIPD